MLEWTRDTPVDDAWYWQVLVPHDDRARPEPHVTHAISIRRMMREGFGDSDGYHYEFAGPIPVPPHHGGEA